MKKNAQFTYSERMARGPERLRSYRRNGGDARDPSRRTAFVGKA